MACLLLEGPLILCFGDLLSCYIALSLITSTILYHLHVRVFLTQRMVQSHMGPCLWNTRVDVPVECDVCLKIAASLSAGMG
jgi:hypothetical protein